MISVIRSLPILILYPHARCNCRCIMCDIWKDPSRAEISVSELQGHMADIERLSVRWVVLSGGEPLMHSDLFRLCAVLRSRGIRVTLLSTGLLLERYAESIATQIDDALLSLDGPPAVHDRIRRVPGAFSALERGVQAVHRYRPEFPISGRCTIQKANFRHLCEAAITARELRLRSLSFLAVDLTSGAFNRPFGWKQDRQLQMALSEDEIDTLQCEFDRLLSDWEGTGFIVEDRFKLDRITNHFRAHLGLTSPISPRCNAPWVSAVLDAEGTLRPCFFHEPIGSTRNQSLLQALNGPEAIRFRSTLDVANNPTCQKCVCSLYRASE